MKKALLSLAVAGLALSVAQSAFAQIAKPGQAVRVIPHGPYQIVEAYPAVANNVHVDPVPAGVTVLPNNRFSGATQTTPNVEAVPGVLALAATGADRQRLNVNAFATCPPDYENPVVQSYRLIKQPGSSQKCPGTYPTLNPLIQFSQGIRTWWTLIYTAPGTTFTLEVTVTCQGIPTTVAQGQIDIHKDVWTWQVVVTFDSLRNVLRVLHSNALGTSEIPCIASEDMYLALQASLDAVRNAYNAYLAAKGLPGEAAALRAVQDRLFEMEALLIAFSAFGDCFVAEGFFNSLPPSNDMQNGAFGWTGVLDTLENPCACKILVDIEKLALAYGIVQL